MVSQILLGDTQLIWSDTSRSERIVDGHVAHRSPSVHEPSVSVIDLAFATYADDDESRCVVGHFRTEIQRVVQYRTTSHPP